MQTAPSQPALSRLVGNTPLYAWHIAQLPVPKQSTPEFHADSVTGEWKMRHAEDLHQLEEWLTPEEVRALLVKADCLDFILKLSQKN